MVDCRLLHVNVRDFKSFRGEHLIGPFSSFSGVIGPNGSGKSNVLDALAFCLYLDLNPRSDNYIHRPNDGSDDPTSCSVTVTLEVDHFERTFIRQEGAETLLYLDGEEVSPQAYRDAIAALRITPLAFVKQAEVNAVARKSPTELTQFFEEMSGSAQFAADYDRYRLESEPSHEAVNLIEKRRRAAISEKRHISVRIDEATKFRELSEKVDQLEIEWALYQLFHYKRQLDESTEESTALAVRKHVLASESENIASEIQHLQRISNETRSTFLSAKQNLETIEQKLREVRANRSMKQESYDILSERLESTKEKLNQHQNAMQLREQDLAQKRQQRDAIAAEIAALPQVDEFESEISEYNTLRERASQQFSDVTQALRAAVQERNAAQRVIDDLIAQRDSEETSRRRIEDTIALTKEERLKLTARLADASRMLDEITNKLAVLKGSQQADLQTQARLLEEKQALERRYDDAKRSNDTNKRRARLQKAISTMQRLVPGVYGRFLELCRPAHRKYDIAVYTACAGYADAIIVKDQQVAIRCIDFLREQGAGSALFLPLRALQPPRVRTPKSAPLLSSVLIFDDIYRPAVDYVCGSTAVTPTIKAARRLMKSEGIPVVTEDGAVVEPGGILTGGSVREDVSFANFDLQKLEQDIVRIEQELAVLGDRIEKHATEIQRGEDQRLSLGPQRDHFAQRRREIDEKLKFLEADRRKTDHEITETGRRIDEATRVLRAREAAVEGMDLRQAEIDRAIFAHFCARAGVEDVRQFEVTRLQTFEERYARRLQLQSKLAQLENFIFTDERADPAKIEGKLQDDLAKLKDDYEQTSAELDRLGRQYEQLIKELDLSKSEKIRWQSADESNQLELRQLRRNLQDQKVELEQTDDSQAAADHERDTALQNVQSILQQIRLSNVQLPLLQEREAAGDSTPSTFTQEEIDRRELEAIDFRGLSAARRAKPNQRAFETAVREYEELLGKMRGELNQIRPDLKSDQRIQAVEREIATMVEEQEQLRKVAAEAKTQFVKVKKQRKEAFVKLYEAIDASIDRIYKKLTRVKDQPNRSGTAYLALEDTEEPYLGGIKFTAMPPHKRFRDLEQLSGGEKAVASLALIIAMQKHLAAPFILMDEPDASLDKLNLRSAAGAFRDLAGDTQIVSVSLRDRFFEHADILVGIFKDSQSSGVLTLDLGKFVESNLAKELFNRVVP